jgi:hypothetical protein
VVIKYWHSLQYYVWRLFQHSYSAMLDPTVATLAVCTSLFPLLPPSISPCHFDTMAGVGDLVWVGIINAGLVLTPAFTSDAWPIIFMLLMALSNGYLSSICMMYGPTLVQPESMATAGTMMVCYLSSIPPSLCLCIWLHLASRLSFDSNMTHVYVYM